MLTECFCGIRKTRSAVLDVQASVVITKRARAKLLSLTAGALLVLQTACPLAKDNWMGNEPRSVAQNEDRHAGSCRNLAGLYSFHGEDVPGASTGFKGVRFRFDELFGPLLPREARSAVTKVTIRSISSDRLEVEYGGANGLVAGRTIIPASGARSSCGPDGLTVVQTVAGKGEAVSGIVDVITRLSVDETGALVVREEKRWVSRSTLGLPLPVSPGPEIYVTRFSRAKE
jgi:hypothetical protein